MAAVDLDPVDLVDPPRRGAGFRARLGRFDRTPYILILPMLVVLAAVLGYPLFRVFELSLQHQTTREMFNNEPPSFVGLQNFRAIFGDSMFWGIVERTFVVMAIMVTLSMAISMGLALLLNRVSKWIRTPLMAVLMFVWAVPSIVSVQVFYWLVDPNFGVLNYVLDGLGFHFQKHDWFADTNQGWMIIIAVVVWGAIPFLTVTLTAGMSMVPQELGEAARIDGANAWQVFKAVTYPILKPLVVIVTSLSVIWDFTVFNQIFAMRQTRPEPGYYTIGIYAYEKAFVDTDYGLGSAISVVMIVIMLGMMIFYVRQMLRIGDGD